jgi:hypothetical protein
MDIKKNRLAQEINSIEEINNPEPVKEITKEYREELISNMIESNQAIGLYDNDPIIEEEPIKQIEDMIDPIPEFNEDVADTPTPEAVPVIEERIKPKNTVRIMDGNFTF